MVSSAVAPGAKGARSRSSPLLIAAVVASVAYLGRDYAFSTLAGSAARSTMPLPFLVGLVLGAAESQPHYHTGKLTPYEIGPPSLLLSAKDEGRLRSGKAVMQALVSDDGQAHRMIMVQDIPAPSSVVMERILDLNAYDRMVAGVDRCVTYASNDLGATRTIKSTYEISALHMRLKYFVEHTYDPEASCMVFRLDYSRRSDLDDTVGYWYVEDTGAAASRVYYSCECKLRGWVPGPVYNMLTKEALKKATTWVCSESIHEWETSRQRQAQTVLVQFVDQVRGSLGALNLPPLRPPRLPAEWMAERREAAVRFVSAVRSPKAILAREAVH